MSDKQQKLTFTLVKVLIGAKDGLGKKGSIKVQVAMDAFSRVTEFIRMSEAREHARKFLHHFKPAASNWLVFDKASI